MAGGWAQTRWTPRELGRATFVAFSQSAGVWTAAPWPIFLAALALCVLLLAAILAFAMLAARMVPLGREDEIAAVFCGSKKSLASGLPMAQVLFAGSAGFGLIILPIVIYNQVQILFGAFLARRYEARAGPLPA